MPYNKNGAAQYAETHAQSHATGNCARYVRQAIEYGGGISVFTTNSAKDYGPKLVAAGFFDVTGTGYPQKGDVIVIQSIPGHPHGNMAMFTGSRWVSDYRQSGGVGGFYPGITYQQFSPSYKIYRHN